MEKRRPSGWETNTQGVLEAQSVVAEAILAAVQRTNNPKEAREIVKIGEQLYVRVGSLMKEPKMSILQRVQNLGCRIGRALSDVPRTMTNWE